MKVERAAAASGTVHTAGELASLVDMAVGRGCTACVRCVRMAPRPLRPPFPRSPKQRHVGRRREWDQNGRSGVEVYRQLFVA